jgi:hypothetical protein
LFVALQTFELCFRAEGERVGSGMRVRVHLGGGGFVRRFAQTLLALLVLIVWKSWKDAGYRSVVRCLFLFLLMAGGCLGSGACKLAA